MMQPTGSDTPLPTFPPLAWLVDAGPDIPMPIRSVLLEEMVGSLAAALPGPVNGLLLNSVALCLGGGRVFAVFLAIEATLLAVRFVLMRRAARNRARGIATPPDFYLYLAAGWCALQGAMAFTSMASRIMPLQILSATSLMALIGPICARNYGAPRYAMLLLALCFLPLVIGVQTLGQPWLLIMLAQAPLLFIGAAAILKRYHKLSVTALRENAASQHRAAHDSLTGLLNRAGFAECLLRQYEARESFVLFYLDLDGFKPVNDRFGHEAGDRVLAGVAERLRACVRKTDIVARIGGDEFVMVVPGMTASDGERFAGEIIRRISAQPYDLETESVRIGVSVGYACAPGDGRSPEELQRRADAALYRAKSAGKGVSRRFIASQMAET